LLDAETLGSSRRGGVGAASLSGDDRLIEACDSTPSRVGDMPARRWRSTLFARALEDHHDATLREQVRAGATTSTSRP